ncbi:MAG: PD-(D/E)XK nuclease family protein [Gammaproteobacteria bacterium]|nr:PD-(D/E)XK nuclease family protein [Gammaproteobacteria bacterium]
MKRLFSHLSSDTYILTENAIQTQFLMELYLDYQTSTQLTGWVNPNIMPLSSWLQKQWHALLDAGFSVPLLLSEHQQDQLWQQSISLQQEEAKETSAWATLAKNAHRLALDWEIEPSLENLSEQNQPWLTWRHAYEQLCEKKQLNDEKQWIKSFTSLLNNMTMASFQTVLFSKKIVLYGFLTLSPLLNSFFQALKNKNIEIILSQETELTCKNNTVSRLACDTLLDEVRAMMNWAQQEVEKGSKKIACFVPNLPKIKPLISRHVTEESQVYFHAPTFFANTPLVYSALATLSLLKQKQTIEVWSYLLRSPWLGDAKAEMSARAHLVEVLYKKNKFHFSVRQVSALAITASQAIKLNEALSQLPEFEKKQTASAWVDTFNEMLSVMGWPGEVVFNEKEKAFFQSWQDLLIEFSRIDVFDRRMSLSQALYVLNQLAAHWRFQSQENKQAPIQVFPLHASFGLYFDAIWVMGLQESHFPAPPKPNTILPIQLQKKQRVPHASYEWELDYSRAIFQHLIQAAPQVILSYAQQDEVGKLDASAFLCDLPVVDGQHYKKKEVKQNLLLEYYQDDQGSPLTQENISGGSEALRFYSLCAFRGFAKHRLKVSTLSKVEYGLTPRQKGVLLHRSLEHIWKKLKDQARLQACSEDVLMQFIRESVETALFSMFAQQDNVWLEVEKMRLIKLLMRWMEYEKKRTPFVVTAIEKTVEVCFSDLHFTLRVDRIDQIDAHTYYLIDYKTGQPSVKDCLDSPPSDPQLPFYALTSELPLKGLLFAQIRSDNMGFKGLVLDSAIPGVHDIHKIKKHASTSEEAWLEQMQEWHTSLSQLILDIKQGRAVLNPKEGFKTCRACDLHALCRIYESGE